VLAWQNHRGDPDTSLFEIAKPSGLLANSMDGHPTMMTISLNIFMWQTRMMIFQVFHLASIFFLTSNSANAFTTQLCNLLRLVSKVQVRTVKKDERDHMSLVHRGILWDNLCGLGKLNRQVEEKRYMRDNGRFIVDGIAAQLLPD
jgi:hypothetical protein